VRSAPREVGPASAPSAGAQTESPAGRPEAACAPVSLTQLAARRLPEESRGALRQGWLEVRVPRELA